MYDIGDRAGELTRVGGGEEEEEGSGVEQEVGRRETE